MTKKLWWVIGILCAVVVIGAGTFTYIKNNPTKAMAAKMSDKEWKDLGIEKQFKVAPAGHYVHLTKSSPYLYKTSWSEKQFHEWYNAGGHSGKEKITFGTSKTFDDKKIVDSENDNGEVADVWSKLFDNTKFTGQKGGEPEDMYQVYFNSAADAKKDPDVGRTVSQIVR
ncbi:major histocompatibility class I related protein [Weissella oryzae SG25]|uniref:Major histocompatibility class I related protein n=1 Tax=Weissella oryzae (strain DSM 25784 / JCM 18191 / LMG 30913 / SG25) TaxID=1329250 RepID=A0A069D112_WEIOS|nr:hypothetical protein [Weissella oryzae]GAK31051.1 major histocompatibility class I related protein [Weissella oryzae SG25]